jgi:hypothetical protein
VKNLNTVEQVRITLLLPSLKIKIIYYILYIYYIRIWLLKNIVSGRRSINEALIVTIQKGFLNGNIVPMVGRQEKLV